MENTTMEQLIAGASAMEEGTTVENTAKDSARKQEERMMIDLVKQRADADPTFKERVGTMSASLEVVHTMTYTDKGGLAVNEEESKRQEKRVLKTIPEIVGYEVKNVGDAPIAYKTAVCEKGADGIYVDHPVDAVLNPGETAFLTRQYMTMLTSAPEFSFELANGKIVKGPGATKAGKSVKEILESFHFTFSKESGKSVNDDEIVIPVANQAAPNVWVVKPEFEKVFGLLNNPRKAKKAERAKGGAKITKNAVHANYVHTVVLGNK